MYANPTTGPTTRRIGNYFWQISFASPCMINGEQEKIQTGNSIFNNIAYATAPVPRAMCLQFNRCTRHCSLLQVSSARTWAVHSFLTDKYASNALGVRDAGCNDKDQNHCCLKLL